MDKCSKNILCWLSFCGFIAQNAAAEDRVINANLLLKGIVDSNFSQGPYDDAEQITLVSGGGGINKTFARQQFTARAQASNYRHDTYPEFDATLYEGKLNWKGKWGSLFNTEIEGERDQRLADRIEFFEKDIVNRDELKAKLGVGNNGKLSFHVGGQQASQTHSNILQEGLDYDEEEGFFDMGYKTGNKSTLILRVKSGTRTYLNDARIITELNESGVITDSPEILIQDLDFDYKHLELESVWVVSPKTNFTVKLEHFEREGFINSGSGELATLEAQWEFTPKIHLHGGYSYSQPAIGETSESPTNVQTYFASVLWQLTGKFSLSSSMNIRERKYEGESVALHRVETLYSIVPLTLTYSPMNALSILLDTGWRENVSPISTREYSALQSSLSLRLRY